MAVPAPARPFLLRLADGRTWAGVEFTPGGFICIYRPDEYDICLIAISIDGLLADRPPEHELHGATVEDYGWEAARRDLRTGAVANHADG